MRVIIEKNNVLDKWSIKQLHLQFFLNTKLIVINQFIHVMTIRQWLNTKL